MAKTNPFAYQLGTLLFVEAEESQTVHVFDGELSDQNYIGEVWRTDTHWANGDNIAYGSRDEAARALLAPTPEPLYEVRNAGVLLFIAPLAMVGTILHLHPDAEERIKVETGYPGNEGCELSFNNRRPLTNDITGVTVTLHRQ